MLSFLVPVLQSAHVLIFRLFQVQGVSGSRASKHLARELVMLGCVLFYLGQGNELVEKLSGCNLLPLAPLPNGLVPRDCAQSALWKTSSSPRQGEAADGVGKR